MQTGASCAKSPHLLRGKRTPNHVQFATPLCHLRSRKDFAPIVEWHSACPTHGRGITDELPIFSTNPGFRACAQFHSICTESSIRAAAPARSSFRWTARCTCGVFTTPTRHPVLSHPRLQRRSWWRGAQSLPLERQRRRRHPRHRRAAWTRRSQGRKDYRDRNKIRDQRAILGGGGEHPAV